MKTIEQQLDALLPPNVRTQKRNAAQRAEYFDRLARDLRAIGRAGVTAEQAARNMRRANIGVWRG
jgi:hypothetical protein